MVQFSILDVSRNLTFISKPSLYIISSRCREIYTTTNGAHKTIIKARHITGAVSSIELGMIPGKQLSILRTSSLSQELTPENHCSIQPVTKSAAVVINT